MKQYYLKINGVVRAHESIEALKAKLKQMYCNASGIDYAVNGPGLYYIPSEYDVDEVRISEV